MKISAKGRYGLAAMIILAEQYARDEYITVISISEELDISKIYLEQVFSLLKRGNLVTSVKGSQGGYKLTRTPQDISVFDILSSIELTLFEKTKETVSESAPEIEIAMRLCTFNPLDSVLKNTLQEIALEHLVQEAQKHRDDQGYMFYI